MLNELYKVNEVGETLRGQERIRATTILNELLEELDRLDKVVMPESPEEIDHKSGLFSENARIKADINEAITEKIGAKAEDIDDHLTDPSFRSEQYDPARNLQIELRHTPGKYGYDTIEINLLEGNEFLNIRDADFHGQRTHDIDYVINLPPLNSTDQVVGPHQGTTGISRGGVRIKTDYFVSSDGAINQGFGRRDGGQIAIDIVDDKGFKHVALTGEKAVYFLAWLDKRLVGLLKEVNPKINPGLYARDSNSPYVSKRRVEDLDMEAEKMLIEKRREELNK